MNDLDLRARAIVEAARDADDPLPADRDRIKRAILVQVATGAVASTATAGTMTLGMKVGLAVLAVSVVGGGMAELAHLRGPRAAAGLPTQAPERAASARGATASPFGAPTPAAPQVASSAESQTHRSDKPRKAASRSGREGERLVRQDRLDAEVAVLKRAREELRLGRPARALEALQEYDRLFGKGELGEERQAMAAIAACQANPGPEARAQARAFMSSSPHSPLLDRVGAACITPARAVPP